MTFRDELAAAVRAWDDLEGEREAAVVEEMRRVLMSRASVGCREVLVEISTEDFERISPWWRFWRREYRPTGPALNTCERLEVLGVPYRCEYGEGELFRVVRVFAILMREDGSLDDAERAAGAEEK